MSVESGGSMPGVVRDLSNGRERTPAEIDAARGPDRAVPEKVYYDTMLRLPGFGEQPERCMARKPVGFCEGHGHVLLSSASPCDTRRCPEHWTGWQREAAVNIVARLAAYRHAQDGAGKRLLHVVDAPDPDSRWWTAEAFWKARSESYDAVADVGGRGGVSIPHPYRTSEEGDWLFETAVARGDWEEDRGKWSLLRDAADDWAEMQRYIEPGPHYHHLVAAENFDPDQIPDDRVVKNIDSLERFELRDMTGYRDMARRAMYLLSHTVYQSAFEADSDVSQRNTVTYWGEAHPNAFNPEEELTVTEWDTIQRMAARAVTSRPSDDLLEEGSAEEELRCPRDGCESLVLPIEDLRSYMADVEWLSSIPREQRRRLRGALIWLDELADRPPPSTDEDRIRGWMQDLGRQFAQANEQQVGLRDFQAG